MKLADLLGLWSKAVDESIESAQKTYQDRWIRAQAKKVNVQVGSTNIEVPAIALQPDAYPYPERFEFETELELKDAESLQKIKVKGIYSVGAIPEGYALERERRNTLLSIKLEQSQ